MIGAIGWSGVEVTTIPTAGIAIDGKQYVNYMSVRAWGTSGHWDTNLSATAVSADNGQTWSTPLNTIRVNAGVSVPTPDGWPSVRAADGPDLDRYEHWAGSRWTSSIDDLGTGDARVVHAPGSELSVAWSPYLNRYLMLDTGALGVALLRTLLSR